MKQLMSLLIMLIFTQMSFALEVKDFVGEYKNLGEPGTCIQTMILKKGCGGIQEGGFDFFCNIGKKNKKFWKELEECGPHDILMSNSEAEIIDNKLISSMKFRYGSNSHVRMDIIYELQDDGILNVYYPEYTGGIEIFLLKKTKLGTPDCRFQKVK